MNNKGNTPLHEAVFEEGCREAVELLLIQGADIGAVNDKGNTPLHEASKKGHREIVKVLLSRGADIKDVTKNGSTPLHVAARYSHREVVELLLAKGANIRAVDEDGTTPLHVAAETGCKEVVELLLIKGADIGAVDNKGNTPLHHAVQDLSIDSGRTLDRHKKVVKLLLDNGANFSTRNYDGLRADQVPTCNDHLKRMLLAKEEIESLLARDKETDGKLTNPESETLLHSWALYIDYEEPVKFFRANNGVDIMKTDLGRTLLHRAASEDDFRICDFLVRKDATLLEAFDRNNKTPLHLAAIKGNAHTCKMFVQMGANQEAIDKEGHTALLLAL